MNGGTNSTASLTEANSEGSEGRELRLLYEWQADDERRRKAVIGTVSAHVALVLLVVLLPSSVWTPARRILTATRITPLFLPHLEPTQPDPNKAKINRNFDVDSLQPRARMNLPKSNPRPPAPKQGQTAPTPPAPVERAQVKPVETPPPVAAAPKPLPDAPPAVEAPPVPPPQIQPVEKPKLAFETPGAASMGDPKPGGKIPVPNTTVAEALRQASPANFGKGPSGGMMVGDLGAATGGTGEFSPVPQPGRNGSALELLSDPMGVDFRPYLIRVLSSVRRNWFAIMPESARLGRRGRVIIQFSIDREGKVPKLVIVTPSGADPLDRAAVAGISASNPFPPLPLEFRGAQIRLQFAFQYNMPAN